MLTIVLLAALQAEPAELLREVQRLREKGETAEALRAADRAVRLRPEAPELFEARARLRSESGDDRGALEDLDRAVALAPGRADLLLQRGGLRYDAGRLKEALDDLDRAVALAPRNAVALKLRGFCKHALQDAPGTVADLTLARELGDDGPDLFDIRGRARFVAGNPRGAVSDFSFALRGGRAVDDLPLMRAWAYLLLDAWDFALDDLKLYLARKPEHRGLLAPMAWTCRARGGDRRGADEEMERLLAGNPGDPYLAALAGAVLGRPAPPPDPSPEWASRLAFWRAMKAAVDGNHKVARQLFHSAAAVDRPHLHECAAARQRVARARYEEARDRLSALEARWRGLPSFKAEFEGISPSGASIRLQLHVSSAAGLYARLASREGAQEFLVGADRKLLVWTESGEARAADLGPFVRAGRERQEESRRALAALLGGPPPEPLPPPVVKMKLDLEAAPAGEAQGSLRFAFGWALGHGRPSWSEAILDALSPGGEGVDWAEEGDDLVARFPAAKKTIRLDRETGFLRSIEVVEADGPRRLSRTSFESVPEGPSPKIPASLRPVPVSVEEMQAVLASATGLGEQVTELVRGWSGLERSGRLADAEALLCATAARELLGRLELRARQAVRAWAEGARGRGLPPEAWAKAEAELAEGLEAQLRPGGGWSSAFSDRQSRDVEEALREAFEAPVSQAQQHLAWRLRDTALNADRVLQAAAAARPALLRRLVREELEILRRM